MRCFLLGGMSLYLAAEVQVQHEDVHDALGMLVEVHSFCLDPKEIKEMQSRLDEDNIETIHTFNSNESTRCYIVLHGLLVAAQQSR